MPGDTKLDALRREFERERPRVVVVVGAGVSIGATGDRRAGWKGLLEAGIDKLVERGTWTVHHGQMQLGMLGYSFSPVFDIDELLQRADSITKALGAPDGEGFASWLAESVGALRARDGARGTLEAIRMLHDGGATIMTTNYDGLLCEALQLEPVTWKDHQGMLLASMTRSGVLHVHGHWKDASSIILGRTSYDCVRQAPDFQDFFKGLWQSSPWLYVGCGKGIDDPNLGGLLRWGYETFGEAGHRHYFLTKTEPVPAEPFPSEGIPNIVSVGYGNHEELPELLRSLLPRHRPGPFSELGPTSKWVRQAGSSPLDGLFPTWRELVDGQVPALQADAVAADALRTHGRVLILDRASVGKTTLALRLATSSEYRESPTFYLDLAGVVEDEVNEVVAATRRLSRTKALIVVDNAHHQAALAHDLWLCTKERPSASRLILLATQIQRTSGVVGSDALSALVNDPDNAVLTVDCTPTDIESIFMCVMRRITRRMGIPRPPELAVTRWHRDFRFELGAFVAAINARYHDLLGRNWELPLQAAAAWMQDRHLENLRAEAIENLICLSIFSEQELEMDVAEDALPHPQQTRKLLERGLVERRERGRRRHCTYALREPGWGRLLLAAVDTPLDVEEELVRVACRNLMTAMVLSNRFRSLGQSGRHARLWKALASTGDSRSRAAKLAPLSFSYTLTFLSQLRGNGYAELAASLFDAWQSDAEHLTEIAFETSLGHLSAALEAMRQQGMHELSTRLWSTVEKEMARLAECAFETPFDQLCVFLDTARATERRVLAERLWSALEQDASRLANRAFDTPLNQLGTFLQTARQHERAALMEKLWSALQQDVPRLADRAFDTPLDQLAAFLQIARQHERAALMDRLWSALELNVPLLAKRAFDTPLDQLAAFLQIARQHERAALMDKLWSALELDVPLLAKRAFDTPLDQLAAFLQIARQHGRSALMDKLWSALELNVPLLAKRAFDADLGKLAAFIQTASQHGRAVLIDGLWSEFGLKVSGLAERAFDGDIGQLAAFIQTARQHDQATLMDGLWSAFELNVSRLAERAFDADLGQFAAFIQTAHQHGRATLIDGLWSALELNMTRLAERALDTRLDQLGVFLRIAHQHERATLIDGVLSTLELNVPRLMASAFDSPLGQIASFIATARGQHRHALVAHLCHWLQSKPDRLRVAVAAASHEDLLALLQQLPEAVARLSVAALDAQNWGTPNARPRRDRGLPRLASQLARLGREELADVLRKDVLLRADPLDFSAPQTGLYDVAVLLSELPPGSSESRALFLERVCTPQWVRRHSLSTHLSVLSTALMLLGLSQSDAVLGLFMPPGPRINVALAQLGSRDGEALCDAVRFLGAAALVGRRLPRLPFLSAPMDLVATLPTQILPPSPGTDDLPLPRQCLWLGLRTVASFTSPIRVTSDVVPDALRRWRALLTESAADHDSKRHRLNQSMTRWLEECQRSGDGKLVGSRQPLWEINEPRPEMALPRPARSASGPAAPPSRSSRRGFQTR
jgi:hypothetical protein